jgi:hypothetical protein
MVKDDVAMPCRVYTQVINEIEYYLTDNFQKQYEEIELRLKINIKKRLFLSQAFPYYQLIIIECSYRLQMDLSRLIKLVFYINMFVY